MKDAKGHGSDPRGGPAHQQGIDQIWSVNNSAANIKRAQQLLDAAGVKNDVYKSGRANAVAHVLTGEDTVHLNAANKFWQNPMQHMEEKSRVENRWGTLAGLDHYRGSYYSSDAPDHVIHHESAHALYADVPKRDNKFTPTQVKMIREKVSGYAAHNPNEFVAEVHAGMKAGRQYPGEVMDLFKQYARRKK